MFAMGRLHGRIWRLASNTVVEHRARARIHRLAASLFMGHQPQRTIVTFRALHDIGEPLEHNKRSRFVAVEVELRAATSGVVSVAVHASHLACTPHVLSAGAVQASYRILLLGDGTLALEQLVVRAIDRGGRVRTLSRSDCATISGLYVDVTFHTFVLHHEGR
jgi:hypothetical protein